MPMIANLGEYPVNEVVTGDSRLLAKSIPDESVDVIFTDPIYQNQDDYLWLAETAKRILKPEGFLLCWSNGKWHRVNANWLESAGMVYRWDFACVKSGVHVTGFCGKVAVAANRLIWLDKSHTSKMVSVLKDGFIGITVKSMKTNHKWTKDPMFTTKAVLAFSREGQVVYDPFCGGGTILHAVKKTGRDFIASEIDPKSAELARSRIRQTFYAPELMAASNKACSGRLATSAQKELFLTDGIQPSKARGATRRR